MSTITNPTTTNLPRCPIPMRTGTVKPLKEITLSAISSCEEARTPSPDTPQCPTGLTSSLRDFERFVDQLGGSSSILDGCLVIASQLAQVPALWWRCSGSDEIGILEMYPSSATLYNNLWFRQGALTFNNETDRCANRNRVCADSTLSEYRPIPALDAVNSGRPFMFYLHGCLINGGLRKCAYVDPDIPARVTNRTQFQRASQYATCGDNASAVLASPINFPPQASASSETVDSPPTTTSGSVISSNSTASQKLSTGSLVAIVLSCSIAAILLLVGGLFLYRRMNSKRTRDPALITPETHGIRDISESPSSYNDKPRASFVQAPFIGLRSPSLTSNPRRVDSTYALSPTEENFPLNHLPPSRPLTQQDMTLGRSQMQILPMINESYDTEILSMPVPNFEDIVKAFDSIFETLERHVLELLTKNKTGVPPMNVVSQKLAGAATSLVAQIHEPQSRSPKFPVGLDIRFRALLQLMAKYDTDSSLFSIHGAQELELHKNAASVYHLVPPEHGVPEQEYPNFTLIHESVFPGWILGGGDIAIPARVVVETESS